nr:MAG TPA: hypothetical protein [Caudoviricetes sp.]
MLNPPSVIMPNRSVTTARFREAITSISLG